MNRRGSRVLKNISYVVVANVVSLLVSFFLSFFLPKILGVEEYGYWQLYSLIISYAGFFHLGMIDGIYLRIGGSRYGELDFGLYKETLILFNGLIVAASVILIFLSCGIAGDNDHRFVLLMSIAAICAILDYTYFNMIMQATNRIRESSRLLIIQKTGYFAIVILCFLAGRASYKSMIISDLLSRLFAMIFAAKECGEILTARRARALDAIREMREDVRSGINLMLANVAGMLMTGMTRFVIVGFWNISVFGNISIAITVANLLFTFMQAISTVLFPILRRMDGEAGRKMYEPLRITLDYSLLFMIAFYYPIKIAVGWWLPQYEMGLKYMALLFPMVIFESKSALLLNTYLKNYNMEKQIFRANMVSLAVCAALSLTFGAVLHSLFMTVITVVLVLFLKSVLLETSLMRKLGLNDYLDIFLELVLSAAFIAIHWNHGNWLGMGLYIALFLAAVLFRKNHVCNAVRDCIRMLRG